MLELKKFIESNRIKRVAITRLCGTASDNVAKAINPGQVDVFYMKKFMQENGVAVDIINAKDNADMTQYDMMLMQPSSLLYWGGFLEGRDIDHIYNYTKNFQGLTMCAYVDPNLTWSNPLKQLAKRPRVKRNGVVIEEQFDHELIEKFAQKKLVGAFIGTDFERFKAESRPLHAPIWPSEAVNMKLGEYIHHHEFENIVREPVSLADKKYDVVYYGSKRGPSVFRKKQINDLFKQNDTLDLRWVGYDPGLPNSTWVRKVRYHALVPLVSEGLTSLVVADKAHNDNIVTWRFYEAVKFNVVNLIHRNFDPEMKLYQDETLRDVCYVSSLEDVKRSCEKLRFSDEFYNKVLDLQLQEVKRVAATWSEDGPT